jgi:hypothetical protein
MGFPRIDFFLHIHLSKLKYNALLNREGEVSGKTPQANNRIPKMKTTAMTANLDEAEGVSSFGE